MINSRKIEDLHPRVAALCHAFVEACAIEGIDVAITSTYRDSEVQNALYAEGRTTKGLGATGLYFGRTVTNARGGDSYHQYRCAFDFVPIIGGKARYDDVNVIYRCGAIGKSVGLEWAGDWKHGREFVHLQFTGGLTLSDLKSGKQLPES